LAAIQAVAPALGVELTPIGIRDAGEVERAVTAFARGSTDGMIVTPSTLHLAHRELIATVAARHRLPAVYGFRYHVTVGGLLSYGPCSGARLAMWIAFLRVRSRPTCRCKRQPSTSW
jgi:putative ABC transport system substrate-binding protein